MIEGGLRQEDQSFCADDVGEIKITPPHTHTITISITIVTTIITTAIIIMCASSPASNIPSGSSIGASLEEVCGSGRADTGFSAADGGGACDGGVTAEP